MPGSDTPNFAFYRPANGETGWGAAVDDSFTDLDALLTQMQADIAAAVDVAVNLDGGSPSSTYGGIAVIDGGSP